VLCEINCTKPRAVKETISFRKIKSIDIESLRDDISTSELCCKQFTDLDDLCPFKTAKNHANYILSSTRREYYTNHIIQNSTNQRKLFESTKALLCEPCKVTFQADKDPGVLANEFGEFFVKKIDDIHITLDALSSRQCPPVHTTSSASPGDHVTADNQNGLFTSFKPLTCQGVSDLIAKSSTKSCPLDPMPTMLILQVLDVLLPVITSMINLPFESSYFADEWKDKSYTKAT
ncbi:hypothetical protein QZH41_013371, partial [Actinostola sp. cb2023]